MQATSLFLALFLMVTAVGASDPSSSDVDRIFAKFDRAGSPGCSVGVIRNGEFTYKKSFGKGSLELGVPLSAQSVFYMGSVSKQFTAAAVVLAAEEGFLSLDGDVRKYVPELPTYEGTITLRQLLHQTSGIKDFLSLAELAGRDPAAMSPNAALELIARQRSLNNRPGEEFVYSNSNYFLLAVVVNRATKKTLAEFAAEQIFRPLGMAHTRFYDDHTVVVPNRVAAYDEGKDGKFLVDWSTSYELVGGGGVMSTVDDMIGWDRNFYENKLGKGTLLKELESRGVLNDGNHFDYAMGLWLGNYRGLPTVGHDGALYGYRTSILRFPEQRFSVIALCNVAQADAEGLSRKVADVYLAKEFKAQLATANMSGMPRVDGFAGTYLDPRTNMTYTFTAEGGQLHAWGAALQRISANQFYDLSTDVITFQMEGESMKATLALEGEPRFFVGTRVTPPHLSEADLSAYAGQFRSDELDVVYTLSLDHGDLRLAVGGQTPITLKPIARDVFDSDLGAIVFGRETNGVVRWMSVFNQRARGMEFKRMN